MANNNNKNKQQGLGDQVFSEFETSIGNDYGVVKEETPVKKKEGDKDETLNQLRPDEDSVKNEQITDEEPPKMSAPEDEKEL